MQIRSVHLQQPLQYYQYPASSMVEYPRRASAADAFSMHSSAAQTFYDPKCNRRFLFKSDSIGYLHIHCLDQVLIQQIILWRIRNTMLQMSIVNSTCPGFPLRFSWHMKCDRPHDLLLSLVPETKTGTDESIIYELHVTSIIIL